MMGRSLVVAITVAAIALSVAFTASPGSAAVNLFGFICCYSVPAGSMKPTLPIGTRIFIMKYGSRFKPELGDVVVFELPKDRSTVYIKRVVGLPGDRVQMVDGVLHLNGTMVRREPIEDFIDDEDGKAVRMKRFREILPNGVSHETLDAQDNGFLDNTAVFEVPAEHYFMMGDNRDNSVDSRMAQVGYVPLDHIIGRMRRP
jgi:signal peptidase I